MKKRPTKKVPILCFIASIFFAAFVLMEFRSDYVAVGGAGIVLLIAAYFLVDRIEQDIYKKYERDRQDIHEKFEEMSHSMDEKWNRLEVILKGIYVVTKKGTNTFESKREDNDLQKQGIDVIVKHNEENARQLVINTNDNTEKVIQELHETTTLLSNKIETVIQTFDKLNSNTVISIEEAAVSLEEIT